MQALNDVQAKATNVVAYARQWLATEQPQQAAIFRKLVDLAEATVLASQFYENELRRHSVQLSSLLERVNKLESGASLQRDAQG